MSDGKIPQCIGIILDGNRRWAKERNLPALEGHQRGMKNVEPIARAARDRGVQHMIIYAFSTENWNRPKEEISYLMEIFDRMAREHMAKLVEEKVAIHFIGQLERFPTSLQNTMREVEKLSPIDPMLTLWVCLSYGGRAEIAHAARAAGAKSAITEESIARELWTSGMPDPDLIIRTGGAQRLSNFLLWQAAYSELFFVPDYWPDFNEETLDIAIAEYMQRDRRRGI